MFHIVVTDDDAQSRRAADNILKFNGYDVITLESGFELVGYLQGSTPDLILLAADMQDLDGYETLKKIRSDKRSRNVPVIFMLSDHEAVTETRAIAAGVDDIVSKPFVSNVLLLRVKNIVKLNQLQIDLKEEVRRKNDEVLKEMETVERLSIQIVQTIAGTIDAKDRTTRGHSSRVAKYAREIAKRAGFSPKECEDIFLMGLMHDVGKIGVPDSVINKPSKLTAEEYEAMKTHPMVGFNILKNISEMPKLAVGARWHHERYDGKGYPDGLKNTAIPAEARILAVADAYDAMSSRRSYHDVFAQEYIRSELEKGRGSQFDPEYANIMLGIMAEDTDYKLCETANGSDDPNAEDNTVFGFLSMLETGGVNTALGIKYCMNDVEFYKEMLHEFVSNISEREARLTLSLENNDMEKYRVYVHSLKSSALMVGAEKLFNKAKEQEESAAVNRADLVSRGHDELIMLMRQITGGMLMALGMYD